MQYPLCRFCSAPLRRVFVDLGMSPVSNSFVKPENAAKQEPRFPLKALVCDECKLVQIEPFGKPDEIFDDYVYFSSFSESWLRHAEHYATAMIEQLNLTAESLVIEIASNDGYLLQYFKRAGIQVLGIEPAHTVAKAAIAKEIPTRIQFFGTETARQLADEGLRADLLIGNNVLAHVPDLNDFVAGMKIALKPGGTITMEFPHLMQLIENAQFDTIYHEHFSYFSFLTVSRVFEKAGLQVFDVEEIPTHGGSLRIYARHPNGEKISPRARELLERETAKGYHTTAAYEGFVEKCERVRADLLAFLEKEKAAGKRIAAYGAAAKGNTLLNYCGAGKDLIEFVADANPHKQNLLLPGTHIPVVAPSKIKDAKPDYVLILPWNLRDEIADKMSGIRAWDGKFIVAVPALEVF
jgi:SAM-dependent methyltransferase